MKSYFKYLMSSIVISSILIGCYNNPIDDDELLITTRSECYVSNFDLTEASGLTARYTDPSSQVTVDPVIDTVACTIEIKLKFGADLKNLKPNFSLCQDAKLEPKITGLTDFSDLENPRKYTVVSGNRKVKKTYTIYITVPDGPQ